MDDLRDLYQEMILEHSKKPRNYGTLEGANCEAKGHNPLCGDQIDVSLKVKDGKIEDLRFTGHGCAISTASASLMTQMLKGRTIEEAANLFRTFHGLLTTDSVDPAEHPELGKLTALAGVRDFPIRVKCATLAWHTLHAALENQSDVVSTE